jgi:hypothetical protein
MTNLIERFTYVWEIDHDKTPEVSNVYGGAYDAHEAAAAIMALSLLELDIRGSGLTDFGGGITLRWQHTGLEEVPEETGGDN